MIGRIEHRTVAAELGRNQAHRRDHHDVDHDVLDEGDHRRCADAAGIGIKRENGKSNRERDFTVHAQALDHRLHADQLQCNVRHGGDDAGHRDGRREPLAAIHTLHEVGRGNVVFLVADAPQFGHHEEDEGIDDDGVRQRKEAACAVAIHRRRHRDHGIGGIKVPADQEPGNPGAELTPTQAPLVELGQVPGLPARSEEADDRDEGKKCDEYDDRRDVQGRVHGLSALYTM